jgi:hypothetical protein
MADFSRLEILGPLHWTAANSNVAAGFSMHVDRQSLSRELFGESDDGGQHAADQFAVGNLMKSIVHRGNITLRSGNFKLILKPTLGYCPFLEARSPARSASPLHANAPLFVRPYQRSPL